MNDDPRNTMAAAPDGAADDSVADAIGYEAADPSLLAPDWAEALPVVPSMHGRQR